jgi:site-specific recombinase XerD
LNRQSRRIVEAVVTHADACLELKAHPHMLRHARGYAPLIQGGLGHRSITSTAIYTALARNSIQGFWRD